VATLWIEWEMRELQARLRGSRRRLHVCPLIVRLPYPASLFLIFRCMKFALCEGRLMTRLELRRTIRAVSRVLSHTAATTQHTGELAMETVEHVRTIVQGTMPG
jgi:hypothetical protein